ncbi:MAG: hypothetical protein ACI8TQ_000820 [Planctomycetota bacterium]|jgi:hypothetical protein
MRPLLHTLAGLLAFATTCIGVQSAVPWPLGIGLRAKMQYFEEHADEYDALFIGSSRVFRDVMPRVIESELDALGFEFKAFNLGVGAMMDFETNHLVRSALEHPGQRLRWVFVESGRWDLAEETESNPQAKRTVEWHSPANASVVLEGLLVSDLSHLELLKSGVGHLTMFGQRFASYGRGTDMWKELSNTAAKVLEADDPNLSDAELALDWGWQKLGPDRAPFDEAKWSRQVSTVRRNESRGDGAGAVVLRKLPLESIKRQIEFIQSKVPNVVYLSLPNSKGSVLARTMSSLGIFPDYLSFDSPSVFPMLYAIDHRVDANHLNQRGATELSKLLAREIGQRLREE